MTAEKTIKKTASKLFITITICVTVLLLSLIGAGVYIHKQDIAQRNKELQQQKQLTEYEQQQINDRTAKERLNERLSNGSGCGFSGC